MKHNLTKRLLAFLAAALLMMTAATGCGGNNEGKPEPAVVLSDCIVKVQTEGGLPLANVGVTIYADNSKTDLIDFVRTDSDGSAKLNSDIPSGSAIFLTEVAEGYVLDEYYTLKEKETVISLKAQLKSELSPIKLGGVMFDFTVTDQNGTEHTLSKLLESKKAAVINLWYTTCGPCKMEFPYLQQAYNEYKDDIALLALSPMDNTAAVAGFAANNGLSLPMASCDPAWDGLVDNIAYPTTIVVDRFGTVALIHIGSIDNSTTFKNLFAHFASADYKQSTFTDMSTFATGDEPIGTASNPYVHSGNSSFSVDVDAAQTVYYTLLGADGLAMSVEGSSLKLVCDEKEYTPSNGKIGFTIKAADATAPVLMQFTNTGSSKATYKVSFTSPAGSSANPITLKDGSVTVKLEENNNHGMYYQYKSAGEGTFTLECKNTVAYTVSIKSEDGNEIGKLDEKNKKITIDVRKNEKLVIVVTAVAKDGKYPAVEAKLNAAFQKEEIPPVGTNPSGSSSQLNTNGKLINADAPIEYGGSLAVNFKAEVKAGEIVLFHLYKVNGMIVRIADASAYIIYLDKTYTPDKNGYVYVPVTSDSPNIPIALQIGNGGKENKTYDVKLSFPEGSMMNPYDAKAGNIKAQLAAGNSQGVYYSCTAEKDGKITITLKNITAGVKCDIQATAYDSSYIPRQHSLMANSEDGKSFTLDVSKGDVITIAVVVQPDEDYQYPAATVEFTLSFS